MTRAPLLIAFLTIGWSAPQAHAQTTQATGQDSSDVRVEPVDRRRPPLQRRVTLTLRGVPLSAALRAIDLQADLRLGYTDRVVPVDRRVSIEARAMPAGEALRRVLEGTGVIVRGSAEGEITLVRQGPARSAIAGDSIHYGVVVGRVMDTVVTNQPRPVSGATILVRGTTLTALTTDQGYFIIQRVPAGRHTILARSLSYKPEELVVFVPPDSGTRADFILERRATRMQQIVTTATGPQRRLEIPNAVTIIDVDSVVRTMPITTVSQLLESRVPGLVAQRSSGAPGAPTRFRLRGITSVYGSNDPILVVDGHRVYARQSEESSRSLAELARSGGLKTEAAVSLIDQLDVNSIEKVEVVSGPSAAALYGADAANGVIVVTTKRGRPGPARWDVSLDRGVTYLPGSYPTGYFRFGRASGGSGDPVFCQLLDFSCVADSLVYAQPLNDPSLTMLGHGDQMGASATVSGGTESLRYRLTGSGQDEQGYLKLPDVQVAQFSRSHGFDAPGWMQRPQRERRWGMSSTVSATLNEKTDVTLTTTLSSSRTQTSTLEGQLSGLMGTYFDPTTGTAYWPGSGDLASLNSDYDLIRHFYTRSAMNTTSFANGVQAGWRPRSWLSTTADIGIDIISRHDESLLPRGFSTELDSVGAYDLGEGRSMITSAAARATATRRLPWSGRFDLTVGADYTRTSDGFLMGSASDLKAGETSVNQAGLVSLSQIATDVTKLGVMIAPMISRNNLYLSTGLRFDAANTYGQDRPFVGFPKLGLSWMISEEPFFRARRYINSLQLRMAYGDAGSEPAPGDRLRLYQQSRPWYDGQYVDGTVIDRLGNTEVRPQRVREFEGGFDAELLEGRAAVGFTGYRKTTTDALMLVPVAPSVYGSAATILKNVGVIRNTGATVTLQLQLVRQDAFNWVTTAHATKSEQMMVRLGPGVQPFSMSDGGRVIAGYPVFGRWSRPILGFSDVNANGVIERSEVQIGDSLVYMGASMPDFTSGFGTSMSFFRNAVSVSADFSYAGGLTQKNSLISSNQQFSRALNDPKSSPGEQAAVAAIGVTDYGIMQTVSSLRFNGLSLAYRPPESFARYFGATGLSVAVQGTNLGLRTNYRGKDPNVNAFSTGNGVEDTGILPEPRSWRMRVNLNY